jgi:uncharacterized repeat protein (TIGR01451 family)
MSAPACSDSTGRRPRSGTSAPRLLGWAALLILSLAAVAAARAEVCVPAPADLLAWWPAEGDARDAWGGHHGTLGGSPGFAPGFRGSAFIFDGGDYVDFTVPGIDTTPGAEVTVSFWMRWQGGDGMPFSFDTYDLFLAGGSFGFNAGYGSFKGMSSAGLAGRWVHVAAVFRNGDFQASRLFLDGTEQAIVLADPGWGSGPQRATPAVRLGNWVTSIFGGWDYWYRGLLDEVALFNRALTPEEVAAIHRAGAAGFCACFEPAPGPESWWRGEDDARDAAGGRHGRLEGGAGFAPGVVGSAFALDGVDDRVVLPAYPMGEDWTVAGWVKPVSGSDGYHGVFLRRSPGNQSGLVMAYFLSGYPGLAGHFILNLGNGASWQISVISSASFAEGEWHHLTATKSGDTYALYVDGTPQGSQTLAGVSEGYRLQPLVLGHWDYGSGQSYLGGAIDEVVVFDYALSAREVAALSTGAGPEGFCPRSCASVSPGPSHRWSADTGDAADAAGRAHGTLLNGASTVPGRVGRAFSFDGVDDRVTVPGVAALDGAAGVSLAAWVRARGGISQNSLVAGKAGGTQLTLSAEGHVWFGVYDGGSWSLVRSSSPIPADTWVHLAGTAAPAGGPVRVFVDGAWAGEVSPSVTPAADPDPLEIGGWGDHGHAFAGEVDEVTVFDRDLSPAEVALLHQAGWRGLCGPDCAPPPPGVVSWWRGEDEGDAAGPNRGSLVWGAGFQTGVDGYGFSFDGAGSAFAAPGAGIPAGGAPRTVTAWIRNEGPSVSNHQGILAYGDWGTWGGTFFLEQRFAQDRLYLTGYMADLQGLAPVGSGRWRHVAAAYDGTVLRFYLDGQPDGEAALSLATTRADNLLIGNTPPNDGWHGPFRGGIDEVAVFDRALSAEEIEALYAARGAVCASPADLALTQTDSFDPVQTGAGFAYGLTVTNDGPQLAEAVTLADTLPPGVAYHSADHPGCAQAGGTVTCALGDLAPGGSVTVSLSVSAPPLPGRIVNRARVSSLNLDPDLTDNSREEETLVVAPSASLEPGAGASFGEVDAGEVSPPATFTLANAGGGFLAVSSVLVAGDGAASFQVSPGGAAPCPSLSPTLAAGSGCTLQVTFQPGGAGRLDALLRVLSDDPGHPQVEAPLSGTGVWRLGVAVDPAGGGRVTGTGIDCPGDCDETFAEDGAAVSLTALPGENRRFGGWTADPGWTGNPLALTVTSHLAVTALFPQNVRNPSFEEGTAPWRRVKLAPPDKPVSTTAHDGSWSFKMAGSAAAKSLTQTVNLSGGAGESLLLKAWSRAEKTSPSGGFYGVRVQVFHAGGGSSTSLVPFTRKTHAWQSRQKTIVTKKAYTKVVVSLVYDRQKGTAWFDDVTLGRQ